MTTRLHGIATYDPRTKQVTTLVYTYRNQLFKDPTTWISTPKVTCSSPTPGAPAPDRAYPMRRAFINIPTMVSCAG